MLVEPKFCMLNFMFIERGTEMFSSLSQSHTMGSVDPSELASAIKTAVEGYCVDSW